MNTVQKLFQSQSVAVIGASPHREKVGHQIFRNLVKGNEFLRAKRKLFPIHPTAKTVLGSEVFPTLTSVTAPIDLVIIATPVGTVGALADEIIERNRHYTSEHKIKFVVIITAGFAETNKKGKELQHLIATKLTLAGIRVLGPNSLGFLYTEKFFNASFANTRVQTGNIGVISQSGAMLTALFDAIEHQETGVSFAVSLGNKSDFNENDFLEYALHDTNTKVIALYLESFSHLPSFFEIASKVSKKKPILLLKGGTSQRGQKASASHTAALATNQILLTAAANQMGFLVVDTIEELLNISFFLSQHRQVPENVMVITNAGGPAVTTIDELEKADVQLAQWSASSHGNFDTLLPQIKPNNPLDLLGDAHPEHFRYALEIAQHDTAVESIIVLATPQAVTDMSGIVREIIALKGRKPIFVSLIGGDHLESLRQKLRAEKISCTAFPNDLVSILHVMKRLSSFLYRKDFFIHSEAHTPRVPKKVKKMVTEKTIMVKMPSLNEVFLLLKKSGFRIPKYHLVTFATLESAKKFSYPLFAKTANLSLLHKKKMGAIYGIVESAMEAERAYFQLAEFGNEVLFQEVIDIDHELLLGVSNDEQFGLFMTFGLGGSYTNILGDRSYVFLPATRATIEKAWKTTKASQIFSENPSVSRAIIDQIVLVQKMIMQNPWLKNLEINPLVVNDEGVWVTDIKVGVRTEI